MGSLAQSLPFSKFSTTFLMKSKTSKRPKKILIIEDDPDMSFVIARALKCKYNCQVEVAQDPFEAMNLMVDKFYDLIILDWHLPGLSGKDTMAEAEKGLRFDPDIPIQWDTKKAPVVIFSSAKKSDCLPRKTKHFDYVGFISKAQPLNDIIDLFGEYITGEQKLNFQSLKLAIN
jgi:CheY-like chemotaxis protein